MKTALADAKAGSDGAGRHLSDLVVQARDISGELELMIAACHDFAEEALVVQTGADAPTAGAVPPVAQGQALQQTVNTVAPEPVAAASGDDDPPTAATPMFGTRRLSAPEPVFRRHAQA
jgi:hypothetical protein